MYRRISLFKQRPKNVPWIWCAIAAILLQLAYSEIMISVHFAEEKSRFTFTGFQWIVTAGVYSWIVFIVSPFLIILVSEVIKHYDYIHHQKNMRRLRIMFETKLGMWSPK
mmetsp:Transcript_5031/g.6349  ORF Transcript_5031/g.6349 Transcript_5031/m.6349 type:complete len:110 (-) Transcript_5031:998-1327(-)